jgi:hypothetical protein
LGAALGLLLSGLAAPASAAAPYGALIIDGAEKVGPDRFRVPRDKDWEKTIRTYKSTYGRTAGIIFRSIATTPEVKAMHIENTNRDRTWEGINIYETAGDIYVYVIKAETEEKPSSKAPGRSKR